MRPAGALTARRSGAAEPPLRLQGAPAEPPPPAPPPARADLPVGCSSWSMAAQSWPDRVGRCTSGGSGASRTATRTRCRRGCSRRRRDDHLLLLEHPHVYTLGIRGDLGHLLRPPGRGGRRAGAHRPRRRRHLPRARTAGRLPDPDRSPGSAAAGWPTPRPTCARSSSW